MRTRSRCCHLRRLPPDQIEEHVAALRKELQGRILARPGSGAPTHHETRQLRPSDTHALGAAKLAETDKMQHALRIRPDYREGEAFQPELQEQRKLERKEARAHQHEESRKRWEERRELQNEQRTEDWRRRNTEREARERSPARGRERSPLPPPPVRSPSPREGSAPHDARAPEPVSARLPRSPPRGDTV